MEENRHTYGNIPSHYRKQFIRESMMKHLLEDSGNVVAIVGFNGTEIVKETIKSAEADIFVEQIKEGLE